MKQVRILRAFVDTIEGVKYRPAMGAEMPLPKGANWVEVGFAEEIEPSAKTAVSEAKATKKRTKRKKSA